MKLNLKDVTLFCLDTANIEKSINAIDICTYYANFYDIKFLTNKDVNYKYALVNKNLKIKSVKDYSKFIIKDLNNYIESKYVLIVQWDGFILNPKAWTDDFLQYDYIGAPWYNIISNGLVGNGGFSLRSKFLLELLPSTEYFNMKVKFNYVSHNFFNEDGYICKVCRRFLILSGVKFAPREIADKFSVESKKKWAGEFGFHSFKHIDLNRDGWINPLL